MTGKDWFVVGTRLIGLGILYVGFQQVMTFLTRGMLFAKLETAFLYDPTPAWMHLVNGGLTGAFALVLLLKADGLADWCYGKQKHVSEENDHDDVGTLQDSAEREEVGSETPPSVDKRDL